MIVGWSMSVRQARTRSQSLFSWLVFSGDFQMFWGSGFQFCCGLSCLPGIGQLKAIFLAVIVVLAGSNTGFSQAQVPVELSTRLSVSLGDRLAINRRSASSTSESVEETCFPRTVSFVKFLETPEVIELLKLERNQSASISRIRKELRVPKELVHAFSSPIPLPADLNRFAEIDSDNVASIAKSLNPDQSNRVREILNSREMRTIGLVTWLNKRTKLSPDQLKIVQQWMEKQDSLIRDRFKEFRQAAVTEVLKLLADKEPGSSAAFLEPAWITEDPWVFAAQLLANNRKEVKDSLESLVEIGAIRFEVLADGNTSFVLEPVSQLRLTYMQIVSSSAYGGIEPSREQLDELHTQLFTMTDSEKEELKVAMDLAQERAKKGELDAIGELQELTRSIEISGLKRLHSSLVPAQTQYLREVLLRRATMSSGPWTILSALSVDEIRRLEISGKQIDENQEAIRKKFLNWEADMVKDCWSELAGLCPDAVREIEEASGDLVATGKPGMLLFFGLR